MAEAGAAASIDEAWLRAHALPVHGKGTDKNNRGHVMVLGASRRVPGGLLLTGEAALRSGAGKVQLAAPGSCAIALGVAIPEAGVIGLDEDEEGEIDAACLSSLLGEFERCDCVIVGPAMRSQAAARDLLRALLPLLGDQTLLIDAVALHAVRDCEAELPGYRGKLIVTPNPDELASILDCRLDWVLEDPVGCARDVASRLGAVTVCKSSATYVADPDGNVLRYAGGGVGLATGGSGDVLAGLVAGLVARGADPLRAAAWGVWLHGEAGKKLAKSTGPIGFLARELPPLVPLLMNQHGKD